ncbi:MAG TPA: hypothetical protein VGF61_15675 [Candidatus Acidoferrum sp.]|jgi:hypothetical protein
MPHRARPILAIAICFLLFACSSAPPTSESDTSFTDARNNFKASDFKAALRNLDKVIKGSSDESQRQQAIVLRTVLVTALADANKQMAEAYYIGAKQPAAQAHSGSYYKTRSDYYNTARSFLMDGMQAVMDQRSKLGATPLVIEVTFPGFQGTNAAMTKIKSGQPISDNDQLSAEQQATRNALATLLSAIAGAPDDLNKGQQIYSSGKVEIDPRAYLIELSNSFYQSEAMFDWRGLNQPDKTRLVNDVVRGNLDIAQKMLTAKPDKDMQARVKKMLSDCDKADKKKV